MTKTIVVLSCGHEKDYTDRPGPLPEIGEEHACWSSCDLVPTYRGRNPNVRHVIGIETRED